MLLSLLSSLMFKKDSKKSGWIAESIYLIGSQNEEYSSFKSFLLILLLKTNLDYRTSVDKLAKKDIERVQKEDK